LIKKTKRDERLHQGKIGVNDLVKYEFNFPCTMLQEDEYYLIGFIENSYMYIFNSHELIFNLILDRWYFLPNQAQQFFGIRQNKSLKKIENSFLGDIIIKTIAHVLFSKNNKELRWNIKHAASHELMCQFGMSQNLTGTGQLVRVIDIPAEVKGAFGCFEELHEFENGFLRREICRLYQRHLQ
jgi:hypothetical protein